MWYSPYCKNGRQSGERIFDTRYVPYNERIHRTGIYNRCKSSDVAQQVYCQRNRT